MPLGLVSLPAAASLLASGATREFGTQDESALIGPAARYVGRARTLTCLCSVMGARESPSRSSAPFAICHLTGRRAPSPPQLNSDLQPFVKSYAGEPASFSLSAAPVLFHRQVVGQERWRQQLQQVRAAPTEMSRQALVLADVGAHLLTLTIPSRFLCTSSHIFFPIENSK